MRNHGTLTLVIAALVLAAMAACTKVSFTPVDSSRKFDATNGVRLFKNYPDVPYEEIGSLRAVGPNKDKLLASISKRAQKIGAHALVVKPVATRSNSYSSEFRSNEFGKVEYIMEAVALRFQKAPN